jgi:Cation transport ATPase
MALAPVFQAGWFIFGTLSQILVVHMIRTAKVPFFQSRASLPLTLSTLLVAVIAIVLVFSNVAQGFDLGTLPTSYAPWLAALLLAYCVTTQAFKGFYIALCDQWL